MWWEKQILNFDIVTVLAVSNCMLFKYVRIMRGSIIYCQQDRQCKYDVTLRSILAKIVAVEKQ
jgi:hypothetical protein